MEVLCPVKLVGRNTGRVAAPRSDALSKQLARQEGGEVRTAPIIAGVRRRVCAGGSGQSDNQRVA
jgi:hypothetical protein